MTALSNPIPFRSVALWIAIGLSVLASGLSGQAAQAAEAQADTSQLATPFFSMSVPHGTTEPTGFTMKLTLLSPADVTVELPVRCLLPQGAASSELRCDYSQPVPLAELVVIDHGQTVRVDGSLAQLTKNLDTFGWGITGVEPIDPPEPDYQPAEAYWHGFFGFGWWTCEIEASDLLRCSDFCGGGHYDISVDEVGATNNPFHEPSCEVSCECWDGGEDEWVDPPRVDGIE